VKVGLVQLYKNLLKTRKLTLSFRLQNGGSDIARKVLAIVSYFLAILDSFNQCDIAR